MNRMPVFDAIRRILRRGFTRAEVAALDQAFDAAEQAERAKQRTSGLGGLSAAYESGGRGAGTVSGGRGDPGGVSYGTYQLASRTGTLAAFLKAEGCRWAGELAAAPGSAAFSAAWKAIAMREGDGFAAAQHAFIERTHYRPAVAAVLAKCGLDLDSRHPAVRDAAWSVAVQHGAAARLLADAAARADAALPRGDAGYDRALVRAIYAVRTDYVARLAGRGNGAMRSVLLTVAGKRYPAELADALAMLDGGPSAA